MLGRPAGPPATAARPTLPLDEKLQSLYSALIRRNGGETEFHQAVLGVLHSVGPVIAKHPAYAAAKLLERICEPSDRSSSTWSGPMIAARSRASAMRR
jgi:hypothetical protein